MKLANSGWYLWWICRGSSPFLMACTTAWEPIMVAVLPRSNFPG